MSKQYDEAAFEDEIAAALLKRGYTRVPSDDFDAERGIFPDEVVSFVQETQPEAWEQLETAHKGSARERFLDCEAGGGAPGSREVMIPISGVPIRPDSIVAFTPMKCGSKRRLNPTMRVAPVSFATSRQARTRAELRSIGFSQKTALPARANSSICCA